MVEEQSGDIGSMELAERYRARLQEAQLQLDELESQQAELRAALGRLSIIASGLSPDLDPVLEPLKQASREALLFEDLRGPLEALMNLDLSRLAPTTTLDERPVDEARKLLRNLIEQLNLGDGFVGEQAQLLMRLERPMGILDLQLVGDDLVALLNRYPQSQRRGLMMVDVLVDLLERLELPAQGRTQAQALIEELREQQDLNRLPRIIEQVADLVLDLRNELLGQQQEMEAFLAQLSERLVGVEQGIRQAEAMQVASHAGGQQLDSDVGQQVEQLEATLQGPAGAEELRGRVQEYVKNIRFRFELFRNEELQRQDELQLQIAEMANRIQAMESESRDLRARLAEAQHQANVDPVTGIANRLAYETRIEEEFARWRRYGGALSLAIWDIDHFKRINDSYGHGAGDKVLRIIAQLLQRHVREVDFLARYGGEEFVMILPETPLQQAHLVADKLRQMVAESGFHYRGEPVHVTISGGVSEFTSGDGVLGVLDRADQALYRAKEEGRNRCHVNQA